MQEHDPTVTEKFEQIVSRLGGDWTQKHQAASEEIARLEQALTVLRQQQMVLLGAMEASKVIYESLFPKETGGPIAPPQPESEPLHVEVDSPKPSANRYVSYEKRFNQEALKPSEREA